MLPLAAGLAQFSRFDALLAIGAGLFLLAFLLRGFHQGEQRAARLRAQDARLARTNDRPAPDAVAEARAQKNTHRLLLACRTCGIAGIAALLAAFLFR